MEKLFRNFSRDEVVALELRRLFEGYGFQKTALGKFEDYALYVDNRRFLGTENIITFMDLDGKLMALKPDVTLSVVKNAPERDTGCWDKLYYTEEVFRLSRENREYKVINQIGLELIGKDDPFSNLEAIRLALESLEIISPDFILDISHSGFVAGLLEDMELSHALRRRIFRNIHAKNLYDLHLLLSDAGLEEGQKERLMAMLELGGPLDKALPKAEKLIVNETMSVAWQELRQLSGILCGNGWKQKIHLDFSVVNDLDYYNGLIFKGYVKGIATAVLFGGRYDNLLKRLKKDNGAIGFAISLDALSAYFQSGGEPGVDYLLLYHENADIAALMKAADGLRADGSTVRVERASAENAQPPIRCRNKLYFQNNMLVKG